MKLEVELYEKSQTKIFEEPLGWWIHQGAGGRGESGIFEMCLGVRLGSSL